MSISESVDQLTGTFSADRSFCDYLFASDSAENAAQILVYCKWAQLCLPHFQEGLIAMVPRHFNAEDVKPAEFWTLVLTAGIMKDICLIPYLVLRGLIPEAGSALRRGLEHAGVLTHFWYDPSKASALNNPKGKAFKEAFQSEPDKTAQEDLKARGVRKRFANFSSSGKVATIFYKVLSEYDVHGGTPSNLIRTSLGPTRFSCGFFNRTNSAESSDVELLARGCEMLCVETATIHATFGKKYGVTPAEVGEGGRLLAALLSSFGSPSTEMARQVNAILVEFRREGL